MLLGEQEGFADNIYNQLNKHIEEGHSEDVRTWLEEHAPVTPTFKRPLSARNPVCLTAEIGNTEIFQLLMEHGFCPNSPDVGGPGYRRPKLQPIHLAAMKGHCDLVELLVEVYKTDVNSQVFHVVPLHFAVTDRQTEVIRYLLQRGACASWLPRRFSPCRVRSPMDAAVEVGYWDAVILMIDSLKTLGMGSFVATLNLLLHKQRKDVAFELYKKYWSITQSSYEMLPLFENFKTLHFLLEVRYPPYFDEVKLNTNIKKKWHKIKKTLHLYLDAGCPLRGRELMLILQGQRSSRSMIKTLSEFLSHPQSLKSLSIFRIRKCLGLVTPEGVDCLPLPVFLRSVLRLNHLQCSRIRKSYSDSSDDSDESDGDDDDDDYDEESVPSNLKSIDQH